MLSVFGMGDHHIEVSAAEASGGQSSEIFIIFDHEVFQKLGGYICIVASNEEVVLGTKTDHVSWDCVRPCSVPFCGRRVALVLRGTPRNRWSITGKLREALQSRGLRMGPEQQE